MSYLNQGNDSMLEMYLFESSTLLEQLDEILLESEKEEHLSSENVNEIFRIMHTIKGSSAMMEFNSITHVSHKLEDLFYIVRDEGIEDKHFKELFDLVLRVSDFLKKEVDKITNGESLSNKDDGLLAELSKLQEKMQEQELAESDSFIQSYNLHVTFSSDCQMENIRAFMLVNKLESIGKVLLTVPEELQSNEEASNTIFENGFYCCLESSLPEEEILATAQGTLSVEKVTLVENFPTSSLSPALVGGDENDVDSSGDSPQWENSNSNASVANVPEKSRGGKPNLINVDLNKLDSLMDLVGEIVITESMVSGNPDLAGLELENFNRASRQLRKLTDELQDMVMSIRMVPIAGTFQKMKRIVRDMGKKLDKEVELVLLGEATEVDKTIIDGIADPLMHLVRNAMDHAIEEKSERLASRKKASGQIILSAQNMGGDIFISVKDDGKGLDPEMILNKAKVKGLLSKPESEYSEKEIFSLLMLPGFSTKDSVTEFSGRGVGMDVVKKNIEKVGGTVSIDSIKGVGTEILFKIPLTLAIISSMEVRVGTNIYALPIMNIRESFKAVPGQAFSDLDGNEMIMIRGACYPIIRLHKIFHLSDSLTQIEDGILLLVDSGNMLACIFADELLGKHQVVVKPLPPYLHHFSQSGSGLAGCTILGDGSISLILDIQSILSLN